MNMNLKKTQIRRIKALGLSAVMLTSAICFPPLQKNSNGGAVSAASTADYDYARALQYSIYFYDANMCGTDVGENNRYAWRDDCHTYDAKLPLDTDNTNLSASFISQYKDILDPDGDGCVNVAGGFHDAGDHVKFGLPEAYAASTLAWGYYEFRDTYAKLKQDDHIETILRYFSDYFMRCTFRDADGKVVAFCYQVGDGDIDHQFWQSPEMDEMKRPGFFATADLPTTDNISNSASALMINYLNFKDTDPEYAEKCLDYAKALYDFATEHDKATGPSSEGPAAFYNSSKWEDDYCWASCWMYLITEDHKYLDNCLSDVDYYAPPNYVYCWNDVWCGVSILLGRISDIHPEVIDEYCTAANKSPYENINFWGKVAEAMENYMKGGIGTLSPQGYFWLNDWGSARYNTAAQLCGLVYDKYQNKGPSKFSEWSRGQMDYLLGNNESGVAYVVGYDDNSSSFPHHRAASGLSKCEDTAKHRHVLYGALVGGPRADDSYDDITKDYYCNEVTIDYNAAFVGACAGLYTFYGDDTMDITPDFPPKEAGPDPDDPTSNEYWVEAFCVGIAQSDGPKASEITFFVKTNAAKPLKNVSVRYYFDAAGMKSIEQNDMELRCLYDQAATEAQVESTLTGPTLYKGTIYYVEVAWKDYAIANSNKKYQFALGTYTYQNTWNPDDDWSNQNIKMEEDAWEGTVERTDNICVYNDGVLIGGIEPDGTKPVVTTTVTTTTTETTTTTTKTSDITTGKTDDKNPAYGDFNEDGKVTISDLVLLARYVAEDEELEARSAQSLLNGDCNGDEKINSTDITQLARYLAKLITKLGPTSVA